MDDKGLDYVVADYYDGFQVYEESVGSVPYQEMKFNDLWRGPAGYEAFAQGISLDIDVVSTDDISLQDAMQEYQMRRSGEEIVTFMENLVVRNEFGAEPPQLLLSAS